jgi:hypothetical protein
VIGDAAIEPPTVAIALVGDTVAKRIHVLAASAFFCRLTGRFPLIAECAGT